MSRSAACASLILLAGVAVSTTAVAGPPDGCRSPRLETAHYKEQVCYRSASGVGYVACRWIHREHDVLMPADCTPKVTGEEALPASPPRAFDRRAGLVAKG